MKNLYNQLLGIGLSEETKLVPFFTDEPKFHSYLTLPNKPTDEKYFTEETFGQGFDSNLERAKIKSIGELLERICLYNPAQEFISEKYSGQENFLRPSSLFCYSEEQIPDRQKQMKILDNGTYKWIKSKNLTTGKEIYIPAQTVYISPTFENEPVLRKEQISTGGAFGSVGEGRAFKSGFLEVIERDGVMAFYLKNLQGRKIKNFPKRIETLINYLKRYNLETHIFNASADLEIPTSFALILDRTGIGDAINVGSKADLNLINAIEGSIMEAIQCRRLVRGINPPKCTSNGNVEENIRCLEDRFAYWSDKERLKDLEYMIEEKPTMDYLKIQNKTISLENAVSNLKKRGYNIIITDITLPELREKGFETLKVTIPELHPLYLDEKAKALFSVHHGEIKDNKQLKPHPLT